MIGLFFLVLPLTLVSAAHRPDYLIPCSKKTNFNACAMEHAKIAIPFLIKGDKKMGLPPLDPLEITLVDLRGADNFHLAIKDIKVMGINSSELLKIDIDFDRQRGRVLTRAPQLEILGNYQLTGHLMIFPINGRGFVNITLVNGLYDYEFEWTLEKKHGVEYAKLTKSGFDYKLEGVLYNFTNLMNGNERLSSTLNRVLNDNWRMVDEDLKDSTRETLLTINNNLMSRLYSRIPYRELFLD